MQMTEYYNHSDRKENPIDMAELIIATTRLSDLVAEETEYLRSMQVSKVQELQEEKLAIVEVLEGQKALIAANPEMLTGYDSQDLETLRRIGEKLEIVMEENAVELLKARAVNERVVEAIAMAIDKQLNASSGYDAQGDDGHRFPKGKLSVPPFKVNEAI